MAAVASVRFAVKLAVTVVLALSVRESGLALPVAPPDQPVKAMVNMGLAVSVTAVPGE